MPLASMENIIRYTTCWNSTNIMTKKIILMSLHFQQFYQQKDNFNISHIENGRDIKNYFFIYHFWIDPICYVIYYVFY